MVQSHFTRRNTIKLKITNIEYHLPEHAENGDDLKLDNPDWDIVKIENKTGIHTRFIADKESVIDMAESAANKILEKDVPIDDIDLLLLVTQTPTYPLPTSACVLHDRLKLKTGCLAFDVNLGCSGYVYALAQAGGLIQSGLASKALVVCSENYTKYIDKNDRVCRPIFSDAAAVTLLDKSDMDNGIGPFELGTDGSGYSHLIVKNGDGVKSGKLFMDGSKVFMFTMDIVPKCVNSLLKKARMELEDIDLFVFHQASKIVIDNIVRRLSIEEEV